MSDDESGVGDGVCREGGLVLTGYGGAEPFGCLANGKREGFVLLNMAEMCHRIPAPLWTRKSGEPGVGGEGYGTSGADARFSVVAVPLCSLGRRKFPFNQFRGRHPARSFRCAGEAASHCDQLQI